jgi:hypothetical protein
VGPRVRCKIGPRTKRCVRGRVIRRDLERVHRENGSVRNACARGDQTVYATIGPDKRI